MFLVRSIKKLLLHLDEDEREDREERLGANNVIEGGAGNRCMSCAAEGAEIGVSSVDYKRFPSFRELGL